MVLNKWVIRIVIIVYYSQCLLSFNNMFTQLFAHHRPSELISSFQVQFSLYWSASFSYSCIDGFEEANWVVFFFPEKVFILPSLLCYYFHLYYLLNDCLAESRMIGWEKISSLYFRYYYFIICPVLLLTRSPIAVALYIFFSILLPRTGACLECSAVSATCLGVDIHTLCACCWAWPFFNLRTHVLFPVLNFSSIVSE